MAKIYHCPQLLEVMIISASKTLLGESQNTYKEHFGVHLRKLVLTLILLY